MFENLHNPRILVIGDLMCDHYLFGGSNRISPEAPVPVFDIKEEKTLLGGAGNVINNLLALNTKVTCLSVLGSDENAEFLEDRLASKNVKTYIIKQNDRHTSKKTRLISSNQQIVRFDKESTENINKESSEKLIQILNSIIDDIDVVILSDYNKGVLHETLTKEIISVVKENKKIVLIDPKKQDYSLYENADIVTPNKKEASLCVGYELNSKEDIIRAGNEIKQKYSIKNVVITLSEDGMAIFSDDVYFLSTKAKEVYDVTGAGDTVISAIAYYYSQGLNIYNACKFANMAAAVVVEKIGSATASLEEIKAQENTFDTSAKIKNQKDLKGILKTRRNKKIVFTNGCFDIIHIGHIKYLQEARSCGDILILGLNSDRSVRELKGENRPINNENDRAYVLSAFEVVDSVVIFDSEDELRELIEKIAPDVLVKGSDYEGKRVEGLQYAKELKLVKFIDGKSTTKTIEKIKK